MNINPELAGTRLTPIQTKITWRQTTNHAAAVNDANPRYLDDTDENGLVSHPMFPVAVTWPLLSRLDNAIEAADFPVDVLLTQVHYSEHLIIHRLVKPDDDLTINGSLTALIPHRAGTHAIICLEARDQDNLPVFTEYTGAMLRGVDCGKGNITTPLPTIPKNNKDNDTAEWTSHIPIDPVMPFVYDGCTNIEFPIHTSIQFAKAVGLPGIILQGTATLALAVRDIVNKEAGMNPERVEQIACNFTGMVMPGTDIRVDCTGSVSHPAHKDLFFSVYNNKDQKAIRNGYVRIKTADRLG